MENANKLIEHIKTQGIHPVPKWHFVLKKTLVYSVFIAAVLLGALAFSIILFSIQQTDFKILSHITHSRLELFLSLLPFVWIISLIIALLLGVFSMRQTPKGYKVTFIKLAGYNTALSVLIGTGLFMSGGASYLENAFAVHIGLYESIQEKKVALWSMPEQGFLSGQIEKVYADTLRLTDFKHHIWIVTFKDAFVAPVVRLEKGEVIKLIGKQKNSGNFDAAEIRPWGGRNRHVIRRVN